MHMQKGTANITPQCIQKQKMSPIIETESVDRKKQHQRREKLTNAC